MSPLQRARLAMYAIPLVAFGLPAFAQQQLAPSPSDSQIDAVEQAYERVIAAEESGDIVGSTDILEWVVFESDAGLAPSTLKEIEIVTESAGLNEAIKQFRAHTGVVTNAYSALGERYLSNGYPEAALPLLSAALVQRVGSLLDAIERAEPSYEFQTLSDALDRAPASLPSSAIDIDLLEDPNIYRDLLNLGLAMSRTDRLQNARGILSILAKQTRAGSLRDLARSELEAL